jgi:hypothetical protein
MRDVGTVQRRLQEDAASAGAQGGDETPANLAGQAWRSIRVSSSGFESIRVNSTFRQGQGGHASSTLPRQNDSSQFKQIQADSSRFKQIQADSSRFKQIQVNSSKFKHRKKTPASATIRTLRRHCRPLVWLISPVSRFPNDPIQSGPNAPRSCCFPSFTSSSIQFNPTTLP